MKVDTERNVFTADLESRGPLTRLRDHFRQKQVEGVTDFVMKRVDKGENFIPAYPSTLRRAMGLTVANRVVLETIELNLSTYGIDAEAYIPDEAPGRFYQIYIHTNRTPAGQHEAANLQVITTTPESS